MKIWGRKSQAKSRLFKSLKEGSACYVDKMEVQVAIEHGEHRQKM